MMKTHQNGGGPTLSIGASFRQKALARTVLLGTFLQQAGEP
jgi:hypothetical protein